MISEKGSCFSLSRSLSVSCRSSRTSIFLQAFSVKATYCLPSFNAERLLISAIQGRLFELALKTGLDCPAFIESFMNSKTAAALDDVYDRLQWAGEEYILEELDDEASL